MNISLFLGVFGFLAVVYLMLGVWASRGIKTQEDYFLAGRKLGFWSVFFTLIATQVGGGMLLGTSAQAYEFGYVGILYTFGMSLGFLLLGLGFASKLRSFHVATTAELFETKYNSDVLKKIASILSVASMIGLLAGQVIALKSLFLGLGITSTVVFILFWAVIVLYTIAGGLKAVVVTDIFQVLFIIAVFFGFFIYSIFSEPSSFFSFSDFIFRQSFFDSSNLSFLKFLPILISPMIFSLIEQDLAQRFFSAKNKFIAGISALAAAAFLISFSFIPVYFGMKARLSGLIVAKGASPLMIFLESISGEFFLVLVVCGLGAAVISTADSLLCAVSSNISQDFEFAFLKLKNRLWLSRITTLLTGVIAYLIATFSDNIIEMLIKSYELLIGCLFVSIFACFFKKKLHKNSAMLSIIFGFTAFVYLNFYSIDLSAIWSVVVSFIGYLIGELFLRKTTVEG